MLAKARDLEQNASTQTEAKGDAPDWLHRTAEALKAGSLEKRKRGPHSRCPLLHLAPVSPLPVAHCSISSSGAGGSGMAGSAVASAASGGTCRGGDMHVC